MSVRGAKPKPTAMKKAAGTLRKHRVNKDEPVFSTDKVFPPAVVLADKAVRAEWNRMAPELVAKGVVTNADVEILAMCCVHYAQWQEALAKVQRDGMVVESPRTKVPMHNMYAAIARQAYKDYVECARELGKTPSARTRVQASEPAKPKPAFGQLRAIK